MQHDHSRIGAQIASLRKARGWSQGQLSEIAGLHLRTVQRAEGGRCGGETIQCLCAALDADARELLNATRPAPELLPVNSAGQTDAVLNRVENGKGLLDLLIRAVAVRMDHDPVSGEQVEPVATFLQSVTGWTAVLHELEPAERVRASARLDSRLRDLEQRGLKVFAAVQERPLSVEQGQTVMRPVAHVAVRAANTPTRKSGRRKR